MFKTTLFACNDSLVNFTDECSVSDRYEQVKSAYQQQGRDIENIRFYKALRFIDRTSYEAAKQGDIEIDQIYKPAPITWNTWEAGNDFSKEIASKIKDNVRITLEDLKQLHQTAIKKSLMTKTSILLKGAKPGRVRSHFWQRAPEFTFSCNDNIKSTTAALIESYDIKASNGISLINGFSKKCTNSDNYYGHVKYIKSTMVPKELAQWLEEFNQYISNFHKHNAKLSPIFFIADMQRKFISIHPFGDGNGRMSRLLQDAFLNALNIPYPASADLGQDLFTPGDEYRNHFLLEINQSIDALEKCLRPNDDYDCKDVMPARAPASFFSAPVNPSHSFDRVKELATFSLIKKNIKSCYRWMSSNEYRKWIKQNSPFFSEIRHSEDLLRRGGITLEGIYCWENPIGAMAGGHGEIYGDHLVRIDFVEDAILYDRNLNEYHHVNSDSPVNDKFRRGIDSEIFYANYWFQEYIIKSKAVIKGWTFGDDQLIKKFKSDFDRWKSNQMNFSEFHFPLAYCPTVKVEHCKKYANIVSDRYNKIHKYWSDNPASSIYYENSLARENIKE